MYSISGQITDAATGAGIENATVVIGQKFALTNQHGFYTITGVPGGTLRVTVLQRYYQKFESLVDIDGNLAINIQLTRE